MFLCFTNSEMQNKIPPPRLGISAREFAARFERRYAPEVWVDTEVAPPFSLAGCTQTAEGCRCHNGFFFSAPRLGCSAREFAARLERRHAPEVWVDTEVAPPFSIRGVHPNGRGLPLPQWDGNWGSGSISFQKALRIVDGQGGRGLELRVTRRASLPLWNTPPLGVELQFSKALFRCCREPGCLATRV